MHFVNMLSRQFLILSLVFLYFAPSVYSNIKPVRFNKTYESNFDWELVHDHAVGKYARDSSWTYASCNYNPKYDTSVECSVIFETIKVDGRVYKEVCQIKLDNPKAEDILKNHFRVFQFGRNKSIVVWHDVNNIAHFYTIHFPTCKTSEATIILNEPLFNTIDFTIDHIYRDNVNVLSFNDGSYDVLYVNRTSDKIFDWHQITFDEDSNVVDGPNKIIQLKGNPKYDEDLPKNQTLDPKLGFVEGNNHFDVNRHVILAVDAENASLSRLWLLGKHGKMNELMSLYMGEDLTYSLAVSMSHDILGVCHNYYRKNKTITCEQHNRLGEKILQVNFESGYDIRTGFNVIASIHNLPKGGFLLFVLPCMIQPMCYHGDNHLYVTKVDANGVRYRTLQIMEYYKESYVDERKRSGFFENGPDEFCWYQLITKHPNRNGSGYSSEISYRCFTDEQLSEVYV